VDEGQPTLSRRESAEEAWNIMYEIDAALLDLISGADKMTIDVHAETPGGNARVDMKLEIDDPIRRMSRAIGDATDTIRDWIDPPAYRAIAMRH
jgi:hypothetical protein